jgi:hypothetical protein
MTVGQRILSFGIAVLIVLGGVFLVGLVIALFFPALIR